MAIGENRVVDRVWLGQVEPRDSAEDFAESLRNAAELWVRDLGTLSMEGQKGAADWLQYETRLWEVGESLRQVLSRRKGWRTSEALVEAIAWIVGNQEFGKGRQPYVELLAKYGGLRYRKLLFSCLDQREIAGHAVKALRIAKIPGARAKAAQLLEPHFPKWFQREAKKYLEYIDQR